MAGLSKSVRRLADTGLIDAQRDGYYVVYSLVPDRLAALSPAIVTSSIRKMDTRMPVPADSATIHFAVRKRRPAFPGRDFRRQRGSDHGWPKGHAPVAPL